MIDLDKNYKIIQITKNQTISSTSSYTEVFLNTAVSSRSYVFGLTFNLSSSDVFLRVEIDGQFIIDELLLNDLSDNSVYDMPKNTPFSFPIRPISNTAFVIDFPNGIQFSTLSLKFKKGSNGNKSFEAGMVSMYDSPV